MDTNTKLQTTDQMQELIDRGQKGDLTCLPALRALLDDQPELWKDVGDLAVHAELSLLSLCAGSNLLLKQAVLKKLARLKAELAPSPPTALEKLLIERIALCWLHVHYAEIDAMNARAKDHGATAQSLYAQRRLDCAHKRYLQAIRQLATVRKLLKPSRSPVEIASRMKVIGTRKSKALARN